MKNPLQISSNDISLTESMRTRIEEKAEKLHKFYPEIISCHVHIEIPNRGQTSGQLYNLRLDITVPQKEIAITHKQNKNFYTALREAFNAATRQLEDYARIRRKETKQHDPALPGKITALFPEKDYGYIESLDGGKKYYFHSANVVHPEFGHLKIGMEVQFIESINDEGLHALRVTVGKHHRP